MRQVLVIEDDASLARGLATALEQEGYRVQVARTGPEGLQLALEGHADLILLDLMLPGMSGFELCKRIRDRHLTTTVIMLTSRSEENDRVFGLELGADDYVTKPFSLRELLARVRAHLRRVESAAPAGDRPAKVWFGDVLVDLDRHELMRAGKPLQLPRRAFRLLEYLIRHPGEVLSRERLLKEAWGHGERNPTRTVDNHILRLRKYIESDPETPRYLKTARGAGYILDLPAQAPQDQES